MKIVIVETNARGGLAQFAYHMGNSLAKAGADTTLLTGSGYELSHLPHNFVVLPELQLWTLFENEMPMDGRRVFSQSRSIRRLIRGARFVRAWFDIVRRVRNEKPDVVILSIIHFPFEYFFLRQLKNSRIELVQVCHEIEKRDFTRGWFDRRVSGPMLRRAYGCFSLIIFLASSVERDFVTLFGDVSRRVTLPHGPPLFLGESDAGSEEVRARYRIGPVDRVVLFFGLLRPSKGVEDLVQAFADIKDRSGVRLLIAGFPTKSFNTSHLIESVQALGIEEEVVLHLEYVPDVDIRPLLEMAELLVLPYRNATASGPAAAAQFLGCPIVATDVGGFRDIIQDGVTGRLVPKGNRVALSKAISEMLDNPDRAQAMAKAAHLDQAENRSWTRFAEEVLRLITDADKDCEHERGADFEERDTIHR